MEDKTELALKLNENKLVLKLQENKNSGRSLQKFAVQSYLKLWVKLKRVQRASEFDQERWMEPVVTYGWKQNSGRKAISKRTFTSSRTTLCLRKRIGQRAEACRHMFKIVRRDKREKILKLIASPLFPGCMQFSNNLACERKVGNWTSPFMHGWRYLKIAKSWCMKTIRCKVRTHIHRYRQPFVGDSDWRCVHGYRRVDKMYLYDTSDYSKDHLLYSAANKNALGRWKTRYMIVTPIIECVCLRPKIYSILTEKNKHQKVKRHKKVKRNKARALQIGAFQQENLQARNEHTS